LPEGFTIAGSYLLNILSEFDNGQVPRGVDFFTNLKYGDDVTELFEKQGYKNVRYCENFYENTDILYGIQIFKKNGRADIEVNFVNEEVDIHKYIVTGFNISCLKNFYDGKQLYIGDITNTVGIKPEGKVAVIESMRVCYDSFYKYLKRGYTIKIKNNNMEYISRLLITYAMIDGLTMMIDTSYTDTTFSYKR
jgi:hypothetical protein